MILRRYCHNTVVCQAGYDTPGIKDLLSHIDAAFTHPLKILKNDPTSTVILVEIEGVLRVIKRTNTRHWTQVLRRWFSRSRGEKNWHNAQVLYQRGIKTFEPIAYIEERWGPLKGRSYFVSSYVDGMLAFDFFMNHNYASGWDEAAQNIAALIQGLATHRISHGDLNLSNIILVNKQPWLIDLDCMRCHRFGWSFKLAARREWQRFHKNWQDVLTSDPKTQAFYQEFKKKTLRLY